MKTYCQGWRTTACYIILPNPWYSSSQQTTILHWVIWKVSGSVSFQEQTIKTGCISTSHFKLQEALMSQGNNFLFICLQMPSCTRIQPVHQLSQKPCGSSQPVLDVTACSCPGWLAGMRATTVWGNPCPALQRTGDATCATHKAGLAPCSPALFQMPTIGPPCQKQALCPLDLWAVPAWPFTFFSYFPLRQCQVLIQCWANRSQQDTLHCVYLGIMKSPTSELASSDPLLSHLCSSPPCLTDRISSSDNSVGTRSWAAHLLQTKQLQLWQSPTE